MKRERIDRKKPPRDDDVDELWEEAQERLKKARETLKRLNELLKESR